MNIEKYKEMLIIDKYRLDDALEKQAYCMYQVAEEYAEKVSKRDALKERIDTVDAEIADKLRKSAAVAGDKLTEANLQQKISMHEQHLKAHEEFLEAKKEAEVWGALKDAFIQRGLALRELASLYTANYFANEPIKGPVEDASDKQLRARLAKDRANKAAVRAKKAV